MTPFSRSHKGFDCWKMVRLLENGLSAPCLQKKWVDFFIGGLRLLEMACLNNISVQTGGGWGGGGGGRTCVCFPLKTVLILLCLDTDYGV